MRIELLMNMKMSNGKVWKKGEYTDRDNPFPEELYVEIERTRKGLRQKKKLRVLDTTLRPSSTTLDEEEMTTLDEGDDSVSTAEQKSSSRKKRRKK